jgi:ribosome-binding factor A
MHGDARWLFQATGVAFDPQLLAPPKPMSHSSRGFNRSERVGQQLHEVIATLLLTEIDDPRVQTVQVVDVETSPDLSNAKVFYVMLDQREPSPEVQEGLERAVGYMKRELGKRLELRIVPNLTFVYDESVERGRRMEELLSDLDTGGQEE